MQYIQQFLAFVFSRQTLAFVALELAAAVILFTCALYWLWQALGLYRRIETIERGQPMWITRRTSVFRLLSLGFVFPLAACKVDDEVKKVFVKKEIVLNVVLFSYLNRPIDAYLSKKWIGNLSAYGGGGGIIIGVTLPLGAQTLTWRLDGPRGMPRNGETITAKNPLALNVDQIPPDTRYLGVHIYPDETAELTFSEYLPDTTPRGEKILMGVEKNGP